MRQIVARSQAEKGQKVKVRLSKDGISITKTVLFQDNSIASFPLHDIYFFTVNQRNPTCLLCIVADPVRKYCILALRTENSREAQEVIATFNALRQNPRINSGNVELRRKDNGNWTLRDRTAHHANRHLQEVFKESSGANTPVPQPNGTAGGYAPVIDGGKARVRNGQYVVSTTGSQTFVDGPPSPDLTDMRNEVDHLSQELRDIKMVLEYSGTGLTMQEGSVITNNNNTEKSHYLTSGVRAKGGSPMTNGGIVTAHSNGAYYNGDRPGEAKAVVEDYRNAGMVRAHSNGSALPSRPAILTNGRVQRQITVPEPTPSPGTPTAAHTVTATSDGGGTYMEVPAYTVHRRVSTEFVQVPYETDRRLSTAESARSSLRVKFDPQSVRHSIDSKQFRSLRSKSGVPSTVVKPIEEIYRPSILKRQHVFVAHPPPGHTPAARGVVPPAPVRVHSAPHHHGRRRSRPSSIHIMEGNQLSVVSRGELDDVLL
nr:hypothetical protein BaRGS_030069 [Batillaria attramentaria]